MNLSTAAAIGLKRQAENSHWSERMPEQPSPGHETENLVSFPYRRDLRCSNLYADGQRN